MITTTGRWLASGRTRVKWAEAVSKRDAKSPQVAKLLAEADGDLAEVTKYSGKTVAAADREEAALELAAGQVVVAKLIRSDQAQVQGAAQSALVNGLGNGAV